MAETADGACGFCAIASGDGQAYVVDETPRAVAVLDINPATRGHTLVIPKRHARDLWDIAEDDFGSVATLTHAVAQRLRDRLAPDGLTLFQANGRAGWQDVFHLHVHLVPRYEGDSLVRPWTSSPEGRDGLPEVVRELGGQHRPASPGA